MMLLTDPCSPKTIEQLEKLIRLIFISDHPGEVSNAIDKVRRLLASKKLDAHWLADHLSTPAPVIQIASADWRREARFCASHVELLTNWERAFIATLAEYRGRPTDKQIKLVRNIVARLRGAAA